MLEQLFSRSLSRYTSSPHAADLDAFATMVAAHGLDTRRTERHTRRLLWVLEAAELPPNATVDRDVLRGAFGAWPHKGYVGTWRLYCRYLHELGRLAAPGPCQPRFALKEQHLRRLAELRGIAPATVTYDNWALTDFLSRVLEPDQEPSSITRRSLDEFFRRRGPQLARRTLVHTVHVVRRYLRYAFDTGMLAEPLVRFGLALRLCGVAHADQVLGVLGLAFDAAAPLRDHERLEALAVQAAQNVDGRDVDTVLKVKRCGDGQWSRTRRLTKPNASDCRIRPGGKRGATVSPSRVRFAGLRPPLTAPRRLNADLFSLWRSQPDRRA